MGKWPLWDRTQDRRGERGSVGTDGRDFHALSVCLVWWVREWVLVREWVPEHV